MPSIAHLATATLLVASLVSPRLVAEEQKPDPKAAVCISRADVDARMGGMAPKYDLKDADLEAFHANFKQLTGSAAPADEELVVYYSAGEADQQALLVSFKGGCVAGAVVIPAPAFEKVLHGNRA